MASPGPSRIQLKRKRGEEFPDILILEKDAQRLADAQAVQTTEDSNETPSKRSKMQQPETITVWRRVPTPPPTPVDPKLLPQPTIPKFGIPQILTTKPGDEIRNPYALPSKRAKKPITTRKPDGTVSESELAKPAQRSIRKATGTPRKFYLSSPSRANTPVDARSSGETQKRKRGKKEILVFEEREPLDKRLRTDGANDGDKKEREKSETTEQMDFEVVEAPVQERKLKRPKANAVEKQLGQQVREKAARGMETDKPVVDIDKFEALAREMEAKQDQQQHQRTMKRPQRAPPRLKYQSHAKQEAAKMDVNHGADEPLEATPMDVDHQTGSYIRSTIPLHELQSTTDLDINHIVLSNPEDEALWDEADMQSQDSETFDTDEEDSNAEDYYANDYPEEEVASADEWGDDDYKYRKKGYKSDDEEYDLGEASGEDGECIAWSDEEADDELGGASEFKTHPWMGVSRRKEQEIRRVFRRFGKENEQGDDEMDEDEYEEV